MPEDPLVGYEVDGLRFDRLLGRGAMGAVYRGVQVALNREVALKVIAPHLADDENYINRFNREAQALGRLLHANVIACHDTARCKGPHGNTLVIMVLEFVDGWSLGNLLKRKHKMTAKQVIDYHRQAAEGLAAAHRLGIIHRDVKPENIMITKNGQAKLADFGLAKTDDSAMLTQTGAILGSPAYMSPEACRGQVLTPASDCYSLGCSLWHSLTGTTPYTGSSAVQALHQHVHAKLPSISAYRPDLAPLEPLFKKLLAKSPKDRFSDASEVAAELKNARSSIPSEAPANMSTTTPDRAKSDEMANHHTETLAPIKNTRKRRRWPLVAVIILIGIALIVIVSASQKKRTERITTRTTVRATLETVENLLKNGERSAAQSVFNQLTEKERQDAELNHSDRVQNILQQLAEKPIEPDTPETAKIDYLKEAEDLVAAERYDEAVAALERVEPDAQTAPRRDSLRRKLAKDAQERSQRAEQYLKAAEMYLSLGQKTQALDELEKCVPPRLDRKLLKQKLELEQKIKAISDK